MADLSKEDQITIFNEVVSSWEKKVLSQLRGNIVNKDLVTTQSLVNSVKSKLSKDKWGLLFNSYGRYFDMKQLDFTKSKRSNEGYAAENIKNWVVKQGIQSFKYIPGYKDIRNVSPDLAAKRIAWGIAVNRTRSIFVKNQYGVNSRKSSNSAWFNREFMLLYNDLLKSLMIRTTDEVFKSVKSSIK